MSKVTISFTACSQIILVVVLASRSGNVSNAYH